MRIVPAPGKSIKITMLNDIQYETTRQPSILKSIIDAILSDPPDIVISTGDCTDDGLLASWVALKAEIDRLTVAGIKWVLATGNHDYSDYYTSKARAFSGNTPFTSLPWATGVYQVGHIENSYSIFNIRGENILVMSLEWSPRDAVIAWAKSVMDANPGIRSILTTHAYLYNDGVKFDWATYNYAQAPNPHNPGAATTPGEGINDGQELWDKLVKLYPFDLVLCGHVSPAYTWRSDLRNDGKPCVQVVANWQYDGMYGGGIMGRIDMDLANKVIIGETRGSYLKRSRTSTNGISFRAPIL